MIFFQSTENKIEMLRAKKSNKLNVSCVVKKEKEFLDQRTLPLSFFNFHISLFGEYTKHLYRGPK
jgi:hypothetical protein